jgi:hypothetical protein
MAHRLTIHEMVKAAAVGTLEQAAVTVEAERQLANLGEPTATSVKTASAAPSLVPNSIPTDYVEKLAGACEYMLDELREKAAADSANGPGKGPNALQVLEATSENNEFKDGHQGQATPAHVVPKTPGTHKPAETPAGPATALDTNAAEAVGGKQKVSSVTASELRKAAADIKGLAGKAMNVVKAHPAAAAGAAGLAGGAALGRMSKKAEFPAELFAKKDDKKEDKKDPKDKGKEEPKDKGDDKGEKKEASAVDPRLVDYFLSMTKAAEDAINPAQISAGAAVPPETSASGESGGAPAGGLPQGPTGLVGSNESAINYTKGQAKAQVKPQLSAVLTEPALSAAHDTTLGKAFDNTGAAGVKISSMRSAAARAVVEKLAEAECAKTDPKAKKKESAGMGNFQAPPVSGAATGAM